VQAVAFPYSFSSALEMRLAGLRAAGHATEARRWLLARSVPRPAGAHELAVYWHLADLVTGTAAPLPERIPYRLAPSHHKAADALCQAHGLGEGFMVLCPFAGGTFAGADKTWPDFAAFAREDLPSFGLPQVLCPGPGEVEEARERYPQAVVLEGVSLGVYGALLQRARLMVSNDTGPGHLAAAVGTPLLSVLGPTDPRQWGAWGPGVHTVQGQSSPGSWPGRETVRARVLELLS
jgi:heptosyltransferase II